ncbi:MAG: DUF4936 family protein [Burkholderiales bacterium]
MRELFVYYRMRSPNAVAARTAVENLQAALREQVPGLRARLLCRDDRPGEPQTWMETYAAPGGIDAATHARIEAQAVALLPMIDGPRHTEMFTACAS